MRILKITVRPEKNGSITYRLEGRDDSGNRVSTFATCPPGHNLKSAMQDSIHSLQVVAAEITEEESFSQKKSK